MKDGVQTTAVQPTHQFLGWNDIRKLPLGEVAPFAVMSQHIAHRHIAAPGSFNAATRFDPIKPAAPVTSSMMSPSWMCDFYRVV